MTEEMENKGVELICQTPSSPGPPREQGLVFKDKGWVPTSPHMILCLQMSDEFPAEMP